MGNGLVLVNFAVYCWNEQIAHSSNNLTYLTYPHHTYTEAGSFIKLHGNRYQRVSVSIIEYI